MIFPPLASKKVILASSSPRRQQLIKELGVDFEVRTKEVEEIYPEGLKREDIATFLAKLKADAFDRSELADGEILVTADTIVCLGDEVLMKPKDYADAVRILKQLSNDKHQVITGLCLKSNDKEIVVFVSTDVYFKKLNKDEISYYLDTYKPFDKAGAYGIQEWIGYIAIEKIEGSFYNVMGLPIQRLYEELLNF
ncbi:MAG: septum formation protein Maf [Bacteroidetes bacterium]|nr:septum formation protein Maf [Bacteroidota bacterium]